MTNRFMIHKGLDKTIKRVGKAQRKANKLSIDELEKSSILYQKIKKMAYYLLKKKIPM